MSATLKRLFRREGTTRLEFTTTTNKNAPPTFVPELIRNKTWIVDDLEHLDKVARYDPVAKFVVYEIAEQVFDDWFRLVDEDGNEVLPEAMRQLRMLNARKAFTQVLAAERTFGYAWLYTGKNRYIPQVAEGGRIASLQCFTPRNCSVFEYDETGHPKTMKIEMTVGKGNSQYGEVLYLPAEDFMLWCTRPISTGYTGRSILEPVWDMLTYLRYEFHAMTFYDIKIGHGLFTAFTKAGFGEDKPICATIFTTDSDINVPYCIVAIHLDWSRESPISYEYLQKEELLLKLADLDLVFQKQRSDTIYYRRVCKVYWNTQVPDHGVERNIPTVFLIKPNQIRYWTRSMALRDADEVAGDIMLWQEEPRSK